MSFFSPNYVLQMQTSHQDVEEDPQFPTLIRPPLFSNLQDLKVLGKRSVPFSGVDIGEAAAADELSDDEGMQAAGEKKRRLSTEQVRTLEKNFELGNKLEPERKMQLASALGLQPRQVAIWFQNRRARWKTKQLEKDYEVLQRQFEAIKSENEALKSHHKKLQSEIMALKGRETSELINLNKETEGSCSNRSENSPEINLDCPFPPPQQNFTFFQSSVRASEMEKVLQSNSLKPPEKVKCPKIESGVSEGISFNNLLCSMELDQSAPFWPWSDHHNFH